jgi:hypothetical protein
MNIRKQILYLTRKLSPLNRRQEEITESNIIPTLLDDNPEWGFLTRIIDIYNFARVGLFNALLMNGRFADLVNFKSDDELTVASEEITKPTGFVHYISLYNVTKSKSITVLPVQFEEVIVHGTDKRYRAEANNQLAIERGGKFKLFGASNGDTVSLIFYKLNDYNLSDLQTLEPETFPPQYHPALIDIAYALAMGEGQSDPTAYASKFIQGGNQ